MILSCNNCLRHAQEPDCTACGPRLTRWLPANDLTPETIPERAALEVLRRVGDEKKSNSRELDKIQLSERLLHRWIKAQCIPGGYFLQQMALAGYDIYYILTGVRGQVRW